MGLRDSWIERRESEIAAANGNRNVSQMHLARQDTVTEEMEFVAKREKLEPELIRSEVARGRMIIPANVNHRNLEQRRLAAGALDGVSQKAEFSLRKYRRDLQNLQEA